MNVQTTEPSEETSEYATEKPIKDEWTSFKATAYCSCYQCCGAYSLGRPKDVHCRELVYTASGSLAEQGKTVAADWSVLPCGTVIEIEGYGEYEVQDKGGEIVGNSIDVYFDSHQDALDFGVRTVNVKVISYGGDIS